MKNPLIFALALALTSSLSAQTTKGAWALGLHNFSPVLSASQLLAPTNAFGLSFGKTKDEFGQNTFESKYTTIGLSGSGHYFLVDNLSGGVNLSVFYQKEKDEDRVDPTESTLTLFMAGPELRYYLNVGEKSKLFFRGQASFGSAKSKFEGFFDDESTSNLSQFGGGAGLTIFLNPQVGLDLGLGYSVFKVKDEDDGTSTNSGVTLDLGFTVFLSGQQ